MTEDRWLESSFEGEMEVQYSSHPSDAVLLGHKWGCLTEEEEGMVAPHMATCDRCRSRFAQLGGDTTWCVRPGFLSDPAIPPEGGTRVGRPIRRRDRRRAISCQPKQGWRTVLVPVGVLIGAASLIGATHVILDRWLAPAPSPFATPVQHVRWWLYLYWALVPLAGWVSVRVTRCAREWRGDGRTKKKH